MSGAPVSVAVRRMNGRPLRRLGSDAAGAAVQVLADDLLEEDATGHQTVEQMRQRKLRLQDR